MQEEQNHDEVGVYVRELEAMIAQLDVTSKRILKLVIHAIKNDRSVPAERLARVVWTRPKDGSETPYVPFDMSVIRSMPKDEAEDWGRAFVHLMLADDNRRIQALTEAARWRVAA